LLLLRFAVSTFVLYDAFARLHQPVDTNGVISELSAATAGIFLLVGLWTPIAGMLVALLEIWIVLSHVSDLDARLLATAVALALSLIGPGAWSVDALAFGRKRISIQGR
jgi:putative oxidoreductase